MSLPLLESFEAQQTAARQRTEAAHAAAIGASSRHAWEEETRRVMKANGHSPAEIAQTLKNGPQTTPSAAPNTSVGPTYTPPPTLLGGAGQGSHVTAQGRHETEAALNESGANSLEGKLTRATQGAREGSEKAGEDLANAAKTKVNLPNPLSWTEAIAKVFSKLAEGSFWIRVLKFVLGVGLLVVALVFFAKAAGLGVPNPVTAATQEASQAVTGAAQANQQRQTASPATAKRVQAAAKADNERDHTPRGKTGKPLAGAALANPARQRARVRERDRAAPSTRELRRGAKRR